MTRRTVVLVFCDMPHEDETAAETVTFSQGRDSVEVDLCADHTNEVFGPLVRIGRVIKARGRKPAAR